MLIKLSKQEIRALEVLSTTSPAVGELAKALGVSPGMASRLAKSLEKKALITVKDEAQSKILDLSLAQHAQAFKRFYETRPNAKIEQWLAGPAIELLILMVNDILIPLPINDIPVPLPILEEESTFSRPTLFRKISQLKGAGGISSLPEGYKITDLNLRKLAAAYADTIMVLLIKKNSRVRPANDFAIRVRKHVVRRTGAEETSPFFIPTGMQELAGHGLEVVQTNNRDYYFNLDEKPRKISIEEAFIHALLLSSIEYQGHPQDRPVLAIALEKVPLDRVKLVRLAKRYLVDGELRQLMQTLEYHKKLRQYE